MNDLCLEVVSRSCQPLRYIRRWISRKSLEIEAWFQRTTNRKWRMGHPLVTWPMTSRIGHVTLKDQTREPNTLRAKYLENSWRCDLATTANYYLLWGSTVVSLQWQLGFWLSIVYGRFYFSKLFTFLMFLKFFIWTFNTSMIYSPCPTNNNSTVLKRCCNFCSSVSF